MTGQPSSAQGSGTPSLTVLSLGDPRDHLRSTFAVELEVPSRWSDNDMYGHVNNAVYYELFDTAINAWVLQHVADVAERARGVVAESACRFFASLSFPGTIVVGLRVERLGTSSVTYRLGAFRQDDPSDAQPAAIGHWVHVYVDPATLRPVAVPGPARELLASAVVPTDP